MAKLKIDNLKNMTEDELNAEVAKLKEELFKLRNEAMAGRVEKPHRISEVKKNIARCYTIMRERKSGRS